MVVPYRVSLLLPLVSVVLNIDTTPKCNCGSNFNCNIFVIIISSFVFFKANLQTAFISLIQLN
jgi:hypothetical protein